MSSNERIVGIDIGTTKIVTLIGSRSEYGDIDILGMGVHPSEGLRKGIVVDIDKTVSSIMASVQAAQEEAGFKVESAFIGIAGGHIASRNSSAARIITSSDRIVEAADRDMAIEAAQSIDIQSDQEVLHVMSRGFSIDGEGGVVEPVGMACRRLEAHVHIVYGSIASIQNVTTCVERAQITVEEVVLEPIASSKAVLTSAEKEVNVLLVDIGGGTCDMALFVNGSIAHTFVLPVGGNHITQDVAIGLKVPFDDAEKIKRQYGAATGMIVDETEVFEIDVIHREAKPFLRKRLAMLIEPRMREMFGLIKAELDRCGVASLLAGGIVVTGGGARLDGVRYLVEDMFDVPVRIGYPLGVGRNAKLIDDPMYATALGLLVYAFDERLKPVSRGHISAGWPGQLQAVSSFVDKVKSWFADYM